MAYDAAGRVDIEYRMESRWLSIMRFVAHSSKELGI